MVCWNNIYLTTRPVCVVSFTLNRAEQTNANLTNVIRVGAQGELEGTRALTLTDLNPCLGNDDDVGDVVGE